MFCVERVLVLILVSLLKVLISFRTIKAGIAQHWCSVVRFHLPSALFVTNWKAKTATTINLNMLKYGRQSQFSDILNYFNQIVRIWWSDWWLGQLVLDLLYKLFTTFLESIAYSWIPLLQPITCNLCIEKYSFCAINNNYICRGWKAGCALTIWETRQKATVTIKYYWEQLHVIKSGLRFIYQKTLGFPLAFFGARLLLFIYSFFTLVLLHPIATSINHLIPVA